MFARPAKATEPIPNCGTLFVGGETLTSNANDFTVERALGKGSFGVVKKVLHTSGLPMAMKEIVDLQTANGRKRLNMEIDIVKKSQECEHIVDYYGVNCRENLILIFMEVMETCMEKVYIRFNQKGTRFPETALTYIAISMLKGLMFLEEKVKAMHRDVKPSNVLLGQKGEIKLTDFGLAKCMDEDSTLMSRVGTNKYLPPERLDPMEKFNGYGYESDIWGYGISIIELAHRKYPYPLDGVEFHLYRAILTGPAPTIPKTYSEGFQEFMAACVIKKRDQRPRMTPDSKADSGTNTLQPTTPLNQRKFYLDNCDREFTEAKAWLSNELVKWKAEGRGDGYPEVFADADADGSSDINATIEEIRYN